MKNFLLALGLSLAALNSARADNDLFVTAQTSCTAVLTAGAASLTVFSQSSSFGITDYGTTGPAQALLELGPYTLTANVLLNQPVGSPKMEPTFQMSLFKGNPISGQINDVRVQGLDLANRSPLVPLSLYGVSSLNFTYDGLNISRVDYSCSLTKL